MSAAHAEPAAQQADLESALLHRRIELSSVRQWDRVMERWLPFLVPPAKLYVLNLWSVFCEPCRKEFPLLRNVMRGWRSHPEVQFLFLADPPTDASEDEVSAFWQKNQAALPDTGPLRSSLMLLRQSLENNQNPITLILDENMIVRQAFVGAMGERPVSRSLERLMRTFDPSFGYAKKIKLSALHR